MAVYMSGAEFLYQIFPSDILDHEIILYIYGDLVDVVLAKDTFILSRNLFVPKNIEEANKYLVLLSSKGHLDALKFLKQAVPHLIKSTTSYDVYGIAMELAAEHGHLDVLIWLESIHDGRIAYGLAPAAKNGHLNVVKYIVENKKNTGRGYGCVMCAIEQAAAHGHLEVVKYLYSSSAQTTQMCGNSNSLMSKAAAKGYLDVIKWLVEAGYVGDMTRAVVEALGGGHLSVIQYLYEYFPEAYKGEVRKRAIDWVVPSGKLEVLDWLDEHRMRGTTDAMDYAARLQSLDVIKWLFKHQFEGCTKQAMLNAIQTGNLEMVKWLYEHKLESYGNLSEIPVTKYNLYLGCRKCIDYLRERDNDSIMRKIKRWLRIRFILL